MHDADTADAVIEHRVVLGEASEAIVLLQAGAPAADQRTIVHVVDGRAIAFDGAPVSVEGLTMAEYSARTLDASLIAIELAETDNGLVVWDAIPVAEFRLAQQLGDLSVAEAIARLATSGELVGAARETRPSALDEEVRHGFALSA
jgi:hypothetical protein